MANLDKKIFQTFSDLTTYLTSKGFTINNNQMRWGQANNNSNCYFTVNSTNGQINFHNSMGETVFSENLIDFTTHSTYYAGVIFLELADSGCALYLTMVPPDTSITTLEFSCNNGYSYDPTTETWVADASITFKNGLIVCSATETDNYWRYSWRDTDTTDPSFRWCIDDCRNKVTKGIELPNKKIIPAEMCVTLTKIYLEYGDWGTHIFQQVLGDINLPMMIFKINGQKYVSFSDNEIYRCPAFPLPPEYAEINVSTSTEEYSPLKTYKLGDYCIYEGLLWRCVQDVTVPTPFDHDDWIVTTVHEELMR